MMTRLVQQFKAENSQAPMLTVNLKLKFKEKAFRFGLSFTGVVIQFT